MAALMMIQRMVMEERRNYWLEKHALILDLPVTEQCLLNDFSQNDPRQKSHQFLLDLPPLLPTYLQFPSRM